MRRIRFTIPKRNRRSVSVAMNPDFSTLVSYFSIDVSRCEHKSIGVELCDFDANLLHKDIVISQSIASAIECGVKWFVVPGSDLNDSRNAMDLSASMDCVVAATAGVHPYNTETVILNEQSVYDLTEMSKREECLAVGECGLDYSPGFPDKTYQLPWFRNAHEDFLHVVREKSGGSGALPVASVVHCFTGTLSELQDYVDMGCYIGLTGHIMGIDDENLKAILEIIPTDKLVIETDAPYMGFKGCRETEKSKRGSKYPNVPASLVKVLARLADFSGISYDELGRLTTTNCFKFFDISK